MGAKGALGTGLQVGSGGEVTDPQTLRHSDWLIA